MPKKKDVEPMFSITEADGFVTIASKFEVRIPEELLCTVKGDLVCKLLLERIKLDLITEGVDELDAWFARSRQTG